MIPSRGLLDVFDELDMSPHTVADAGRAVVGKGSIRQERGTVKGRRVENL